MKDQAIQYLAFDVHQSTVAATVREQGGAIVMRATVPTEARAILRLVHSVGSRVHVAFEEGTQAQWLHDVITPYAERVVVCNTRGEGEDGNKRDRLDAVNATRNDVPFDDGLHTARESTFEAKAKYGSANLS